MTREVKLPPEIVKPDYLRGLDAEPPVVAEVQPVKPAAVQVREKQAPQVIATNEKRPAVVSESKTPDYIIPLQYPPAPPRPAAPPTPPDARLVEIARLWGLLTERDRQELLYIARIKAQLNQQAK